MLSAERQFQDQQRNKDKQEVHRLQQNDLQDVGKLGNVYPLDKVLIIDKDGRGISDNAGEKLKMTIPEKRYKGTPSCQTEKG